VNFSEITRLLEKNGFSLVREKVRSATTAEPDIPGSFEWTITALKRFRQEPPMRYSRLQGSSSRARND